MANQSLSGAIGRVEQGPPCIPQECSASGVDCNQWSDWDQWSSDWDQWSSDWDQWSADWDQAP